MRVEIPFAIQLLVDDVGWWCGANRTDKGEPARSGINRNHTLEDYHALVNLGKALNIKPLAGLIMCEWDKENILRELPTATWMREDWDNSEFKDAPCEEAAHIFRDNPSFIEPAIHGIAHEYWHDKNACTRAEYHDMEHNMRPNADKHLEYFFRIYDEYDFGAKAEVVLTPVVRYRFGADGGKNFATVSKKFGIKSIATTFSIMPCEKDIDDQYFGIDDGIFVIDRGIYEIQPEGGSYCRMDCNPSYEIEGPCCGIHWSNMLHPQPERNMETIENWIKFLSRYNNTMDKMLARNKEECFTQLIYRRLASVSVEGKTVTFDLSGISKKYHPFLNECFTIRMDTDGMTSIEGGRVVQTKLNSNTAMRELKIKPEESKLILRLA